MTEVRSLQNNSQVKILPRSVLGAGAARALHIELDSLRAPTPPHEQN
jgi:hypothetical protein